MKYAFLLLLLALSISCKNIGVDHNVDTLRISVTGAYPEGQSKMASELYRHYINSDRSKEFYEVIAEPRGEILNYHPSRQVLTACSDPGSNWHQAYKVDLQKLKWIGDSKLSFEMYEDSLTRSPASEYLRPKTNGHPSDPYGK